jgi:hypothetical protein
MRPLAPVPSNSNVTLTGLKFWVPQGACGFDARPRHSYDRMDYEDVHRIQFDSTLDEVVDAGIRLTTRTQTFRAYRARAVWVSGGCLSAALLATVFFRGNQNQVELSAAMWTILVVVALSLGAGFGYLYGRYIDGAMRRQYKKIVSEQFGGVTDVRCEIELRREGVWVVQNGMEMTFPWKNVAGIEDTGDAIELRFSPGLVVARNRAFRDEIERGQFLERARTLAWDLKGTT